MKTLLLALLLMTNVAFAQGTLPWGTAISVPLLASQPNVELFYVSSYNWNGTHTDYDMARQAADAFVVANPEVQTYLVLSPTLDQTCDAVPLPSVPLGNGTSATLSIIGYGSNISSITKRKGCSPGAATFSHLDSPGAPATNAWYQGFTIDANHIDAAACGVYGMSTTTFFDVSCRNAAPGSDHVVEFGNNDANSAGRLYNINLYNFKASDSVGLGKGAVLSAAWTAAGAMSGATVVSGGTKMYTQQYTRATVVGPGTSSCTTLPTLSLTVSNVSSATFPNLPTVNYGYVTGAVITNPGHCTNTAQLYILVQDGVPVTYGMKFTNMTSSHAWNLETTAPATYAEAFLPSAGNNMLIGEHPYTNQTIQIADYSSGNKHINAFFDGPGEYGALIAAHAGSFTNSIFSWDGSSYLASSGYYLSGSASAYSNWIIQNSQCTNSTANFIAITTTAGPLTTNASAPSGVHLADVESCDGTNSLNWQQQVAP